MDLFEPEQLHALLEPMQDFVSKLPDETRHSTEVEQRLEQFEAVVQKLTN